MICNVSYSQTLEQLVEEIKYCHQWNENLTNIEFYKEWNLEDLSDKNKSIFFIIQGEKLEYRMKKVHNFILPQPEHELKTQYLNIMIEERIALSEKRRKLINDCIQCFPETKTTLNNIMIKTAKYYSNIK